MIESLVIHTFEHYTNGDASYKDNIAKLYGGFGRKILSPSSSIYIYIYTYIYHMCIYCILILTNHILGEDQYFDTKNRSPHVITTVLIVGFRKAVCMQE